MTLPSTYGYGDGGHAPESASAEAQSLRTLLTTGGLAKGAGEWLPVRLGETIARRFPRHSTWSGGEGEGILSNSGRLINPINVE